MEMGTRGQSAGDALQLTAPGDRAEGIPSRLTAQRIPSRLIRSVGVSRELQTEHVT